MGFHESVVTAQSGRIAHRWWESVATELCQLRIILKQAINNPFIEILTGNLWLRDVLVNKFVNRYICFCFTYRSIGREGAKVLVTDISRFAVQNKSSRMLN